MKYIEVCGCNVAVLEVLRGMNAFAKHCSIISAALSMLNLFEIIVCVSPEHFSI